MKIKKIVLIEDNDDVRENTTEILELANYQVFPAKNGKIGVELAQKEKPDLVICDIMMPVLDGYGVLHMLSKNTDTANIPFIFLTAKTERSDMRKGMEMGADDYVTKPFDDVELLKAVEIRLKKNELLKAEYTKNLQGVYDFFDEVNEIDELKKIADNKRTLRFKKKELIYNEGNHPNGIYLVTKGKIKTYKTNTDGKEYITSLFKEGDFIGYLDLLKETNYNESAAAIEDSEVSLIGKDDFYTLIYKNQQVAKRFIKMLANEVIDKEEQLVNLAYNSVRKRVAQALVKLQERYVSNENDYFKIAISREDVAGMAGTSTETAIRTLSDFKEEKLIEIKGSLITIINIDKLKTLKN